GPTTQSVYSGRGGWRFLPPHAPARSLGPKPPRPPPQAQPPRPLCPPQVLRRFAQGELSTALAPQMPIELRQPPTACAPRTKRTPTRPPNLWPTACPLGGRQSGETTIALIRPQAQ